MASTNKMCDCGQPLHYSDPSVQEYVEEMVERLGPTVPIRRMSGGAWHVPRHYIALHGIKGVDLPALAEKYNWKAVSDDRT